MSTHTPGPWKWGGDVSRISSSGMKQLNNRYRDSGEGYQLEGATRDVLIPWDYESYSAGIYIRPDDARLIAAAPDLYEALERIIAHYDNCDAQDWTNTWTGFVYAVVDAMRDARAALKKARGES